MTSKPYLAIFFLAFPLSTFYQTGADTHDVKQRVSNAVLSQIYNGSFGHNLLFAKNNVKGYSSLTLPGRNDATIKSTSQHQPAQRQDPDQQWTAHVHGDRYVSPNSAGPPSLWRTRLRETSDTLIKRLCALKGHKRQLCYQSESSSCYCTGGLADCTGKLYVPNISYVPKFPQNIKCLKFARNGVKHLFDSYFTNVSSFVVIDFSLNKLESISSKTFAVFNNLQYLILNYNSIDYTPLRAVLDYPPLLRLDIIGLGLEKVPPGYFDPYRTIPTSEIYMDYNYIRTLDLQEFSKLEKLKYLSLINSSIDTVMSAHMPKLKVLYLDHNNISTFPDTCNFSMFNNRSASNNAHRDYHDVTLKKQLLMSREVSGQIEKQHSVNDFSLFPALTDLYFGSNILRALPGKDVICLPRLTALYLESNSITKIQENAFMGFSSLKVLTLDKMTSGITQIEHSAFNSSTLTSLYLSKNHILFGSNNISTKLFQGCSRLEVLSIDHNQLGGVSENAFEELLTHTPALKSLYLSSTNMQIVPVKAFSQMKNLERLYIYVNKINKIPAQVFDEMSSLRYIYMDENQISTIHENSFSLETRNRLKLINLSRNTYICDCNLLWFQSWLLKAGPALFMEYNQYFCSNIHNMSVQHFVLSRQACLFSQQSYILFIVCVSIIMTFFILFTLLYQYRWNIRLLIYERRAHRRNEVNISDEEHYRYDVFVLYCNDDSEWVIELLLPMLENEWRLKTCIHQRDFVTGGFIVDNIAESLNNSKWILIVISSRFALSRWCNFELQMCNSHVINKNLPSLLVIILDEIESRDMSSALMALYNTTCLLEWPVESSDLRDMETFWKRLKRSLAIVIDNRSHNTSLKCVG